VRILSARSVDTVHRGGLTRPAGGEISQWTGGFMEAQRERIPSRKPSANRAELSASFAPFQVARAVSFTMAARLQSVAR